MTLPTGTSWGRYPTDQQTLHSVYWRHELSKQLAQLMINSQNTLAYGNGRSYGDSCIAHSLHALAMRRLDRFIAVDWTNGKVTVESGITLGELLSICIPHGWFLPVTPGTQYVTIGGAVANDVHGKNHHHRGTFGCHVIGFQLIRSDVGAINCTPTKNTELFAATIGGLGLTGIIEWVELQLMPIRSSEIDTVNIKFQSLDEFFLLTEQMDKHYEYSVAWIDCAATGKSLGRGVLTLGNHAEQGELTVNTRSKLSIPFTPPVSLINRFNLKLFNKIYYHQHKHKKQKHRSNYEPFFYPLDRILDWNRLYGRKGFQQYQCVIPDASKTAIYELLSIISANKTGSFLAVLKRCGNIQSPGLLSFPMPGISLALDFPQESCLETLFFHMDTIVKKAGGRLYPAKDAHMTGDDFRSSYPLWEQVASLRDPVLCSQFWNRVTS